jgi:hypothetical protein
VNCGGVLSETAGGAFNNAVQPTPTYAPGPSPYVQPSSYSNYGEQPVSVGEWLVMFLIFMIPCVGIIMMFVWAFSSNTPTSKSNLCKAYLIFTGIMLVLSILLSVIFPLVFARSMMPYIF